MRNDFMPSMDQQRRASGRSPFAMRKWALLALAWCGALLVSAHEGHQPLPTRGVEVDLSKGEVVLAAGSASLLGVASIEPRVARIGEEVIAPVTLTPTWTGAAVATSRLPGTVAAIHVRPGDRVVAGQLLVEIESLELLELRERIRFAEAALDGARRLLEQAEAFGRDGAVTGARLRELESERIRAERRLRVLQAQAMALGVNDEHGDASGGEVLRLPVIAPLSGIVLHADLALGRRIEPTDHLIEILDDSQVDVRVELLERDWHRVVPGAQARLELAALGKSTFPVVLETRGGALDVESRRATLWGSLQGNLADSEIAEPSGRGRIYAGMRGLAHVPVETPQERTLIPIDALASDGAETYVLLEQAKTERGNEYRRVPVVVGRRYGNEVEIRSQELVPGDRIVSTGLHELSGLFLLGSLRVSPAMADSIGLRVESVGSSMIDDVDEFPAVVEIPRDARADVASPIDGVLESVVVRRGEQVRAGQTLAVISSIALQRLQADWLEAAIDRDYWLETWRRQEGAGEAVARRSVIEAETRYREAEATFMGLRQRLLAAGLEDALLNQVLERGEIVPSLPLIAPIDGEVIAFHGRLGQASVAAAPLFGIHEKRRGLVVAMIPEREMSRVHLGQAVRLRFDGWPEGMRSGKVIRISPSISSTNRAGKIWMAFDEAPEEGLPHEMFGRATLVNDSRPASLAIPREAMVQEGLRYFVFVKNAEERFERRAVRIGRHDDLRVAILEGLEPGESIAVSAVSDLQNAYSAVR